MDAELARLVGGGSYDTAPVGGTAHDDGFTAILGVVPLLNGGVEGYVDTFGKKCVLHNLLYVDKLPICLHKEGVQVQMQDRPRSFAHVAHVLSLVSIPFCFHCTSLERAFHSKAVFFTFFLLWQE